MALLSNVSSRVIESEVMDDPHLDPALHVQALRGLRRINRLSASDRVVWRPVADLAQTLGVRRLRLLDVATGGGDVPLALWRRAKRRGLDLEILGLDISPRAVALGQQRASAIGADLHFASLDALAEPLPDDYDVVMCSLFLHHLSHGQAVTLLRNMAAAAKHLLLIHDLERSRLGLLAAQAVCRTLTRSPVVRIDGPRSVRAAFSVEEVRRLAQEADLDDVQVVRRWPFRYLVTWKKPPQRSVSQPRHSSVP